MILLDHTLVHEAESLFSNWEFWIAAFTVISGMVASYYKQVGMLNILKIEVENMDQKYDARVDTLKERMESDRISSRENHDKLYSLCEQMNERLARMEGKLINGRK